MTRMLTLFIRIGPKIGEQSEWINTRLYHSAREYPSSWIEMEQLMHEHKLIPEGWRFIDFDWRMVSDQ